MIQSENSKHDDASSTFDSFSSLPVDDCVYRGEGNANLVVSLPREQRVIRFRKSLPGEASPDDDEIRVKREVEFVRHVVSGYLGSYVRIPEIVRYDAKDVAKLLEIIRPFRPEERKWKKNVKDYATKMPDYAFLPSNFSKLDPGSFRSKSTFAVEIKPKQGYQRKEEQRLQKCPYCLTQYYKSKKKVVKARSSYCPFDLFSADKERMIRAIEGLLRSPQNNLKIFKDGSIVYDEGFPASDVETVLADWHQSIDASCTKETNVNLFCNLTCTALLHSFPQTERTKVTRVTFERDRVYRMSDERDFEVPGNNNEELIANARKLLSRVKEECKRDGENLPKDCVLERILSMQRLPYGGTDHVYDIYEKYATLINDELVYSRLINSTECPRVASTYTFPKRREKEDRNGHRCVDVDSNWSSVVGRDGSVGLTNDSKQWKVKSSCDNAKYDGDVTSNDINNDDLLALQNYLLFCTARDCSILITFRQLNPEAVSKVPREYVIKLSEDLYFLTSISVSDVDPKSMHSIAKHRQRDTDVLNSVISLLEEELSLNN
ncbi:hypothetical protein KPH14_003673 [Odynerus spinipes]|uniref:Inositol-pentakisphosphate 2-kinase n=1 Tax=Odynerus spinipes TaxID=1348599 RepID=A0AAD9VUR2_9HYME|nr:hypothetical protein KPH14_003673 [Odynerus spinipes]